MKSTKVKSAGMLALYLNFHKFATSLITQGTTRVLWLIILCLGTLFASAASADTQKLEDHGWFTRDTVSNRDWLDLTLSTGYSHNTIASVDGFNCNPVRTTGPYTGWTFAKESDVRALMNDAALAPYSIEYDSGSSLAIGIGQFTKLLGRTSESSNPFEPGPGFKQWQSGGKVSDVRTFDFDSRLYVRVPYAEVSRADGDRTPSFVAFTDGLSAFALLDDSGAGGIWFYRPAIPEPATAVLAALGLILVAFRHMCDREGFWAVSTMAGCRAARV